MTKSGYGAKDRAFDAKHAFQAAKTDDPRERAAVLAQATPGGAKRLGCRLIQVRAQLREEAVRHG